MRAKVDCTPLATERPACGGELVTIFVPDDHPLMQLKRRLDWAAIEAVMIKHWQAAGKNVAGGRGLPWPVWLYVPLLVLMWVRSYHARQMEQYVSESVVARRFLNLTEQPMMPVRDHSNIARAEAALGAEGQAEVNRLIIGEAQRWGFAAGTILSSDTTVQEPLIGYPNEPGILKGMAQRIERALQKLKARGVKSARAGIKKAKEIYAGVKEHHLFATTKEEKEKRLAQIVRQSETLIEITKPVISQVSARGGRVKQQAAATLQRMVEVARQLIPQIKYWMKTGNVASEKIIHAGITEARAIVKDKGRVKFGLKWLIHRLKGGYLFGKRVAAHADENKMPQESLNDYRELFGPQATPAMVVYDRGASLPAAAKALTKAGVQKVGIPPRGQGQWMVGAQDQKLVKSQRGQTEGSIGRLKSKKYGFSHRQERSVQTQEAAGQRAILSVNLNTLMRDVVGRDKKAQREAA